MLGVGTMLWRKQKSLTEEEIRNLQAGVKSVWLPIRTLIIYAQVNSQLGSVLNVRFPAAYEALMRSLSSVLSIVDVLVSGECVGLDNFSTKWIKEVVLQPCAMLAIVAAYYAYERARLGGETARKHAAGNAFFVLFF